MADTITLKFLTLEDIKAQARIEVDFTEEDTYLTQLGRAAERHLLKDIQRTYDEVVEMEKEWPVDLTQAALMLTTYWYRYREPADKPQMYMIPYGYDALYMPYRKGTYSSEEDE